MNTHGHRDDDPDTWMPTYIVDESLSGVQNVQYVHTTPLTKFERATVIGHRALQIAQNSRPRVVTQSTQPLDIAKEELLAGSIPAMSIGRYLPDGTLLRFSVQDKYQYFQQ